MPRKGQIDPLGRVDILFSRIVERVATNSNPTVQAIYSHAKPMLDNAIADKLGPRRTKAVRRVLKLLHERGMVEKLAERISAMKGATQ